MTGMLVWKPHLGTLANSLVILLVMGWLCLLWYRYRTRYTAQKSLLLLAPKLLCVLLVLLALMDPTWRDVKPSDDSQKVAVISDISTSMDVADDASGSRAERARKIAGEIEGELRGTASVENYRFDVDILAPGDEPAEGTRDTDLGRTVVSLSERADVSDCKAVVLLTDGGDEAIRSERLPPVPVYILGIGTEPSTWDDLEIGNAEIPEEVELDTQFKVSAEIVVHSASANFAAKVESVDAQIEKRVAGVYQPLKTVKVDPSKDNGQVAFDLPAEKTPGTYQYRLSVKGIPGEMTELNNTRDFAVDVRAKSINVLLYGNMLDWDFALLKREFAGDPTIKLTTVYRKNAEVFRIEGTRQEGDAVFTRGFPKDEKTLGLYTIIVLGSFPAELIAPASFVALKKYVDGGGNLVLLGGPMSFDKGGYYQTAIEPLLPWKPSSADQGINAGEFPVMVPPEGEGHGLSAATAAILKGVAAPALYSVNRVGERRSGALSLMNASVGSQVVPIVVLQPYGKGQTLGVATDTLWRWGRMDGEISGAFHQFWRDVIRYLSGAIEGGRFLTVKWDRTRYRPSEEGLGEIAVVGRYAEGAVHLKGTVEYAGKTADLPIVLKSGSDFQTRVFFPQPGEYNVRLEATLAGEPLDTYERIIRVGSSVSEGADLAVDHPFLESLAARSGGYYSREGDTAQLMQRLEALLLTNADPHDTPLVRKPTLFGLLPIYIVLLMGTLLWEWILRRRMNIV
ncbi:glutamine amidotransferase [Candidatus Sumerlaeota bacterium]